MHATTQQHERGKHTIRTHNIPGMLSLRIGAKVYIPSAKVYVDVPCFAACKIVLSVLWWAAENSR